MNARVWDTENDTDEPVCRTGIEMRTESGQEGTEEKGEGEVNRESRTTYMQCVTYVYKTDSQWEAAVQHKPQLGAL